MATTEEPTVQPENVEVPGSEGEDEQPQTQGGETSDQNQTLMIEMMKTMREMLAKYEKRVQELEEKLNKPEEEKEKKKLQPINAKDLKAPTEYEGKQEDFMEWHERFKNLLITRNETWKELLDVIAGFGDKRINNQEAIKDKLEEKGQQTIKENIKEYAIQLYTYMNSYTKGNLNARLLKTREEGVFEIYRDVVHKGKNMNASRILKMKATVLQPRRAMKADELDKILAEWKYEQKLITEFDNTEMPEEQQKTILMTVMPKEHVEYMRDHYFDDKFKDNYHAFEQELYNRIEQRKLDEEGGKKTVNAVTKEADKEEEYEMTEVWSQEWHCWVCGLTPKRTRDDDEEQSPKRQRREEETEAGAGEEEGKKSPKGKGKRGPRAGGPCWSCGGPHFQRECPEKGKGKGVPHPAAWSAWRPGAFPGPTAQQWRQWMPKKGKGKGKGGKGKGTGKGKGQMDPAGVGGMSWGPALGQVQQWEQEQWNSWGGDLCVVTKVHNEWTTVGKGKKANKVTEGTQKTEQSGSQHNKFSELDTVHEEELPPLEESDSEDDNEGHEQQKAKCQKAMKPKMAKMPRKAKVAVKFGGTLCTVNGCRNTECEGLNFNEQATMIRERCKAERTEARGRRMANAVVLCQEKPINAMPQEGDQIRYGEWQKIELAVDSGAAETVIPHDLVTDHDIKETEMSIAGVCYASATGQPIPNLGEQRLPLMTNEGTLRGMKFQAAPVARPLGSVKRMCEAGHQVVFDSDGSYVVNKRTGEINWMREENGNYLLDLWVMPAERMHQQANNGWGPQTSNGWGFRRQS